VEQPSPGLISGAQGATKATQAGMNGLLMWKAGEDSEADSIRFDAQGAPKGKS
jgi:hypothetical protein